MEFFSKTRYFKIIVPKIQKIDGITKKIVLCQYFRCGQMEIGYITKDDALNELIMNGEITPEDCEHITEVWELNKNEYDRAIKRCIKIRSI